MEYIENFINYMLGIIVINVKTSYAFKNGKKNIFKLKVISFKSNCMYFFVDNLDRTSHIFSLLSHKTYELLVITINRKIYFIYRCQCLLLQLVVMSFFFFAFFPNSHMVLATSRTRLLLHSIPSVFFMHTVHPPVPVYLIVPPVYRFSSFLPTFHLDLFFRHSHCVFPNHLNIISHHWSHWFCTLVSYICLF